MELWQGAGVVKLSFYRSNTVSIDAIQCQWLTGYHMCTFTNLQHAAQKLVFWNTKSNIAPRFNTQKEKGTN